MCLFGFEGNPQIKQTFFCSSFNSNWSTFVNCICLRHRDKHSSQPPPFQKWWTNNRQWWIWRFFLLLKMIKVHFLSMCAIKIWYPPICTIAFYMHNMYNFKQIHTDQRSLCDDFQLIFQRLVSGDYLFFLIVIIRCEKFSNKFKI